TADPVGANRAVLGKDPGDSHRASECDYLSHAPRTFASIQPRDPTMSLHISSQRFDLVRATRFAHDGPASPADGQCEWMVSGEQCHRAASSPSLLISEVVPGV